jgi:hypothetical protein
MISEVFLFNFVTVETMLFLWKKEKTEKLIENRSRGSCRTGIILK